MYNQEKRFQHAIVDIRAAGLSREEITDKLGFVEGIVAEGRRVAGFAREASDGLASGRHRGMVSGDLRAPSDGEVFPGEVQKILELITGMIERFGMSLLFPILLIAVMYFLMIRPQMKRQKEHRAMLEKLSKGDEVITNGGIAGTVSDIGENFITVEIADNVRIRVQKGAIANVLPKGTLKSA